MQRSASEYRASCIVNVNYMVVMESIDNALIRFFSRTWILFTWFMPFYHMCFFYFTHVNCTPNVRTLQTEPKVFTTNAIVLTPLVWCLYNVSYSRLVCWPSNWTEQTDSTMPYIAQNSVLLNLLYQLIQIQVFMFANSVARI